MKIISIGRSENCDIVYNDNMVSRRHAMLRIHWTGKMELIDLSTNGTFVNKTRIKSNVPYPVSRKNVVRFAEAQVLDWTLVQNPMKFYRNVGFAVLLVIAIIIAAIFVWGNSNVEPTPEPVVNQTVAPVESVSSEQPQQPNSTSEVSTPEHNKTGKNASDLLKRFEPKPKQEEKPKEEVKEETTEEVEG